jgi:hypothetical protein
VENTGVLILFGGATATYIVVPVTQNRTSQTLEITLGVLAGGTAIATACSGGGMFISSGGLAVSTTMSTAQRASRDRSG